MTIYSMGKLVKAPEPKITNTVRQVKPIPLPINQVGLSPAERRLMGMYGKLPFSFSTDWDARLEPPA
jgi:hypothetical protein